MNITIVAGARPNFMKIAPVIHAIQAKQKLGVNINFRLVHTGQHYDRNLSSAFFEELNIPNPAINLNVKSGSQSEQTAAVMIGFEQDLIRFKPDLVIVVGDVTSTMACAIATKKACIPLAHIEAGIRSGDLSMPEEINRIVTDSITDIFFTTSKLAGDNLIKSGKPESAIYFVGNVMIDTLYRNLNRLKAPEFFKTLSLQPKSYFVLTLHRPSNVDGINHFRPLLEQISKLTNGLPVIFPVHPRTKKLLDRIDVSNSNFQYVEPQSYLNFIYLIKHTKAVLTDSGGITEEATVLNVPCITFRDTTERPETCEIGTNLLVGNNPQLIKGAFKKLMAGDWPKAEVPELWDGKSAERIVNHIIDVLSQ